MAEREYQRLTWSRRRSGFAFVISRSSLWLGKDHLLYIETSGYSETYRRFYFRDIQAVSLCRTNMRMVSSIVLGALAALLLLIGFAAEERIALIVFVVLAALFCLVPLLINLALGPACKCEIRTAVQTEELPIRRVRSARRILERIRPLIAAAQGQLAVEEIAARMRQIAAPNTAGSAPDAAFTPVTVSQAVEDPDLPPRIAS